MVVEVVVCVDVAFDPELELPLATLALGAMMAFELVVEAAFEVLVLRNAELGDFAVVMASVSPDEMSKVASKAR